MHRYSFRLGEGFENNEPVKGRRRTLTFADAVTATASTPEEARHRQPRDAPREESVNSQTSLLHERHEVWKTHIDASMGLSGGPGRPIQNRFMKRIDSFDDPLPPEKFIHDKVEESCLHVFYRRWREGAFVVVPDGGLGTHRRLTALLLDAWDLFMVLLLLGIAVILPYEVFCIPLTAMPVMMQMFDMFCDAAYSFDIFLQFFVAMPNHEAVLIKVELWEQDPVRIAQRYCNVPCCGGSIRRLGWFWLDITSVLPSLIFHSVTNLHASMRIFLMLRLMRMLGLFRLQRLFNRWQVVLGFSSQTVQLCEFVLITSLSCHWMACAWVAAEGNIYENTAISYRSISGRTWLTSIIESKGDPCNPSAAENHLCVYAMSLYFAVMTLTTVGYGDMTPQNILEFRLVIVMLMVSGIIWAYAVGSMASLLSFGDPAGDKFKQGIGDLNEMCEIHNFPGELRYRMRSYMHNAKPVKRVRAQRLLLEHQLSDGLRGEVALHSIGAVIQGYVYWAKDLEEGAIIDLAGRMDTSLFGPREHIVTEVAITILMRGLAAMSSRQALWMYGQRVIILAHGNSWGHDRVLLESQFLIEKVAPLSLTYCEVLLLSKDHVRAVCANFPAADKKVRRAQIILAVQRAIICLAQEVRKSRKYGKSIRVHDVCLSSGVEIETPEDKRDNQVDPAEIDAALKKLYRGPAHGFCGVNYLGGKKESARQEILAAEERIAHKIAEAFSRIRRSSSNPAAERMYHVHPQESLKSAQSRAYAH